MLVAQAFCGRDWTTETGAGWRQRVRHWREQNPILVPLAAYVAVYAIATCASISPRVSFFGSYDRLQGLYTTLTYCGVFFLLAAHLKTREQMNRIITTMVTASVPITVYAVAQHYGFDPIVWNVDAKSRVISTWAIRSFSVPTC